MSNSSSSSAMPVATPPNNLLYKPFSPPQTNANSADKPMLLRAISASRRSEVTLMADADLRVTTWNIQTFGCGFSGWSPKPAAFEQGDDSKANEEAVQNIFAQLIGLVPTSSTAPTGHKLGVDDYTVRTDAQTEAGGEGIQPLEPLSGLTRETGIDHKKRGEKILEKRTDLTPAQKREVLRRLRLYDLACHLDSINTDVIVLQEIMLKASWHGGKTYLHWTTIFQATAILVAYHQWLGKREITGSNGSTTEQPITFAKAADLDSINLMQIIEAMLRKIDIDAKEMNRQCFGVVGKKTLQRSLENKLDDIRPIKGITLLPWTVPGRGGLGWSGDPKEDQLGSKAWENSFTFKEGFVARKAPPGTVYLAKNQPPTNVNEVEWGKFIATSNALCSEYQKTWTAGSGDEWTGENLRRGFELENASSSSSSIKKELELEVTQDFIDEMIDSETNPWELEFNKFLNSGDDKWGYLKNAIEWKDRGTGVKALLWALTTAASLFPQKKQRDPKPNKPSKESSSSSSSSQISKKKMEEYQECESRTAADSDVFGLKLLSELNHYLKLIGSSLKFSTPQIKSQNKAGNVANSESHRMSNSDNSTEETKNSSDSETIAIGIKGDGWRLGDTVLRYDFPSYKEKNADGTVVDQHPRALYRWTLEPKSKGNNAPQKVTLCSVHAPAPGHLPESRSYYTELNNCVKEIDGWVILAGDLNLAGPTNALNVESAVTTTTIAKDFFTKWTPEITEHQAIYSSLANPKQDLEDGEKWSHAYDKVLIKEKVATSGLSVKSVMKVIDSSFTAHSARRYSDHAPVTGSFKWEGSNPSAAASSSSISSSNPPPPEEPTEEAEDVGMLNNGGQSHIPSSPAAAASSSSSSSGAPTASSASANKNGTPANLAATNSQPASSASSTCQTPLDANRRGFTPRLTHTFPAISWPHPDDEPNKRKRGPDGQLPPRR